MTYPRWLGIVVSSLSVVLILTVAQGNSQDTPPSTTTLRVLLPKMRRVKLEVNGSPIAAKGRDVREFPAPALEKGKKEYEVTAVWSTNNYTSFYRGRKVAPKPGEKVEVDLRKEDPKNPDRIVIRYVPTPDDVVARMCKLAKVSKDDIVFDLGCGDGRIVIAAVADFKAKHGVGVDLDPERIRESNENAKKRGVSDKVKFRVEDVLKLKDLSSATVVMLYMGDDVNLLLRPILQKTLKPGSRVVSHRFGMGDWKPDKSETFTGEDGEDYTIHEWIIKKKD